MALDHQKLEPLIQRVRHELEIIARTLVSSSESASAKPTRRLVEGTPIPAPQPVPLNLPLPLPFSVTFALVQGHEKVDTLAPKFALPIRPSGHGYRLFASRNESGECTYARAPTALVLGDHLCFELVRQLRDGVARIVERLAQRL